MHACRQTFARKIAWVLNAATPGLKVCVCACVCACTRTHVFDWYLHMQVSECGMESSQGGLKVSTFIWVRGHDSWTKPWSFLFSMFCAEGSLQDRRWAPGSFQLEFVCYNIPGIIFLLTCKVVPRSLWYGVSSVRPSTKTCNFFSHNKHIISMKFDHNLHHLWWHKKGDCRGLQM